MASLIIPCAVVADYNLRRKKKLIIVLGLMNSLAPVETRLGTLSVRNKAYEVSPFFFSDQETPC